MVQHTRNIYHTHVCIANQSANYPVSLILCPPTWATWFLSVVLVYLVHVSNEGSNESHQIR